MLSTNEWSTASGSLVAKSRCYWKLVTERLSEPWTLCWEHGGCDELCLNLHQDLGIAGGAAGAGLWGPPAAAQWHSSRFSMLLLKMDLTGMSATTLVCLLFRVFFPGYILEKNVGAQQPACPLPSDCGAVGNTAVCKGKDETLLQFCFFFSFS